MALSHIIFRVIYSNCIKNSKKTLVVPLSSPFIAQYRISHQRFLTKISSQQLLKKCSSTTTCLFKQRSASSEHIKSNSLINNNNNTTKNNEEEKKKDRFLTIPNALTVGRILCTPLIGYFIVTEYYTSALILFLSAGMTDLLDGYIARRFPSQQSAIGSFLDPFADKILVGVVVIAAWYKALIPLWLLALILVRDIAIMLVAGYIRFISVDKPRTLKKVLNMKEATVQLYPTFVSKVNTGVQIGLFTLCLASPVFNYQHSDWMTVIYLLSAASTGVSWLSYVAQGKQTFKLLGKKNPPST